MNNKATADHAAELLSSLGRVTQKRMFGGFGLYAEGVIIALVIFERVFLKTDEQTRPQFHAAACEPFVYEGAKGKQVSVNYFEPPAEAFDSIESMRPWARLAIEAGLRFANAKAAKTRKLTKTSKVDNADKANTAAKQKALSKTPSKPKTKPQSAVKVPAKKSAAKNISKK